MESNGKIYKCIKYVSEKFKLDVMKVYEILLRVYPELKSMAHLIDRNLELKYRFIQPFDPDFTNLSDRSFINFTRSNNLRLIYSQTKAVTAIPEKTIKFIESIRSIDKDSICISDFNFVSYDYSGIKKLAEKYGYLNELIKYIETPGPINFAFSAECLDFNKKMCEYASLRKNSIQIEKLKSCMKNKNIKYVRIHLLFLVAPEVTRFISIPQGYEFAVHSSQVILNVQDNKAYILESSIHDDSISWQKFEKIKDVSVEVFLKNYVDQNIIVEQMNFEECPIVKIQGQTGLCTVWSLYLFILSILNPSIDRSIIYEIFSQYTQQQRDVLIMMFMYWIFKYDKYEGIELSDMLLKGDLPRL